MRNYSFFFLLAGMALILPSMNNAKTSKPATATESSRNYRVQGTITPYNTEGCYLFRDECSRVNYILEKGQGADFCDGQKYRAVIKFVAPKDCGVSGEARIMSISPGEWADGGSFCN